MSINSTSDSGDVNCLVTLSESVFAAGSMDGSLRFFRADQGAQHVSLNRFFLVLGEGMKSRTCWQNILWCEK